MCISCWFCFSGEPWLMQEPSYSAGGILKWFSLCGKQPSLSSKIKHGTATWWSNFTPRDVPKRNQNIRSTQKLVHKCSLNHNSPQIETTQMSINTWMDSQNAILLWWNIVWQLTNEVRTHITTWMNLGKRVWSERSQTQQATYCRIPLMWNARNRKTYRDRK